MGQGGSRLRTPYGGFVMGPYIVRRFLQLIPLLWGISVIVFFSMHVIPGDAASSMGGQAITTVDIARVRHQLHLDQPIIVQYWYFLSGLFHGDFGTSIRTHDSVLSDIGQALPTTIQLTVTALILSVVLGVVVGIIAATHRNSLLDTLSMSMVLVGVSMPVFWTGVLLLIYFGGILQWLPVGGSLDTNIDLHRITGMTVIDSILTNNMPALKSSVQHLILPAVTLALFPLASIARMTRATMVEEMAKDYVRTARAKGLTERVIRWRHTLRNALIPIVTVIGLQLGLLLSGAVLTETVFALPGIGQLAITSILYRDFTVVQGVVLVAAFLFVLVNLAVDVLYTFINPRLRYQ
ncbi:MAG: ABC transporter permease [Chloroflexota bacterium]